MHQSLIHQKACTAPASVSSAPSTTRNPLLLCKWVPQEFPGLMRGGGAGDREARRSRGSVSKLAWYCLSIAPPARRSVTEQASLLLIPATARLDDAAAAAAATAEWQLSSVTALGLAMEGCVGGSYFYPTFETVALKHDVGSWCFRACSCTTPRASVRAFGLAHCVRVIREGSVGGMP